MLNMITEGDLVTVQLSENNPHSNVYRVAGKVGEDFLLNHPLIPECFIVRKDVDLNRVALATKSSTEKCLDYAMKFKRHLDYESTTELESLCMFFIVRRELSPKQKKTLSNICGRVASIYCANDITLAIKFVRENVGVLDEFNSMWYSNFEKIFIQEKPVKTKNQRITIFNMTGFVLAQLESNRLEAKE